jgi:polar amino acid transport system substrate-binding protein
MRDRWGPIKKLAVSLLLAAVAPAVMAAPPTLNFALGQAWAMPFAHVVDRRLQGGILFEVMSQIAANAGAEARITILPPKRVDAALDSGQVDLHCLLAPSWLDKPVAPERWTVALMTLDDQLLARPDLKDAAAVDLGRSQGLSVGLVISYRYPALDDELRDGRLRRDDAASQQGVLEKLARGRTDLAVANSLMVDWFNRTLPASQRLKSLKTVHSVATHCLLSPKPTMAPARIQAAVRQLVDSGQLQTILARYR